MNVDQFKSYTTKIVAVAYIVVAVVNLMFRHKPIWSADMIALTLCTGLVIVFIEIAVRGYKHSMDRMGNRIKEMPFKQYKLDE